jgi:hypothetical protein
MAEKLTDRTAKTSNFADGDLVHVVDVSDTSQDPAGSSFKSTIGNIYGSYLAPKITSAQIIDNAANNYSLTLADTSSTNHYLSVETNDGNAFVNVTITSYASPKDGAILVIRLNESGIGTLTIPGFTIGSGCESGIYTARYSTSEVDWVAVNYLELSVVDAFTDLNDVPSSYSGQANKIVKVNAGETGLEFGEAIPKVYTALLTQTGTNAPVATVLENTIGNIVWSYDSAGTYFGTLSGAFTANKTWFNVANQQSGASVIYITYQDANEFAINTSSNDILQLTPIEIRVDP